MVKRGGQCWRFAVLSIAFGIFFSSAPAFAIKFKGSITPSTVQTLLETIDDEVWEKESLLLQLDSPGGHFYEALKVVKHLRALQTEGVNVTTEVGYSGDCSSSCTIIFAAGKVRRASKKSTFLFHSPLARSKKGKNIDENKLRRIEEEVRNIWLEQISLADPEFANYLEEEGVLHKGRTSRAGREFRGRNLATEFNFVTELF